jgi:hypothetical protein
MGTPYAKREEMRAIRIAIKSTLLVAEKGLSLKHLSQKVYAAIPNAKYDQIKQQASNMAEPGGPLQSPKRAFYCIAGTIVDLPPPVESNEIPDMEVIQHVVPAPRCILPQIYRTPMQFCVDVLGGMSLAGVM